MDTTLKPIADVTPAGYNPRRELTSRDLEYQQLRASIEEFGLVEPLVWNRRTATLVGGHQRLAVLYDLDIEEVPVVEVDLDERQERELNLALNKIVGRWDEHALAGVLESILDAEMDLTATGFTEYEAQDILLAAELADADLADLTDSQPKPDPEDEPPKYQQVTGEELEDLQRDTTYVVTFSMDSDERRSFLQGVKLAKRLFDVESSPDAIVAIANWYIGRQSA